MGEHQGEGGPRYWAFISYSHRDKKWGDWLHRAVETYRVPRKLVGTPGRDGAVPRRLFPVFRDREELPGSPDLGANITQALETSRHLLVICSPRSAKSLWVNEEIKAFKADKGEDRVLCLIVDGEPNATDKPELGLEECFPEAVRYRVDAAGQLTDQRTEPIAADARAGQDGLANAKLKLLAGLLGVGFDQLRQRERIRKRKRRTLQAAAAVVVAVGVGVGWYLQHEARVQQQIEESRRLAGKAWEAIDRGRADRALQLALKALPQSLSHPQRPIVPEAEAALRRAYSQNRLVGKLEGHAAAVEALAFNAAGDRMVSVDAQGGVVLWDVEARAAIARLNAGVAPQAWFSRDGTRVYTYGGPDRRIELGVWEARSGERLRQRRMAGDLFRLPQRPAGNPDLVTFTRPGEAGPAHSALVVRRIGEEAPVFELEPGSGIIERAVVLPPGDRILAVHEEGAAIHSLGPGKGEAIFRWRGDVGSIAVGPNGNRVALEDPASEAVRVVAVGTGETLLSLEDVSANSLAFSPDGRRLYLNRSYRARAWDISASTEVKGGVYPALAVNTEPPVVAGSASGEVRVHLPRSRYRDRWPAHDGKVEALAVSPDGGLVATGGRGRAIRLWRPAPEARDRIRTWPNGVRTVPAPDHRRILWHTPAGRIHVSGGPGDNLRLLVTEPRQGLRTMRWLPGGKAFLAVDQKSGFPGYESGFWIWDAQSGSRLFAQDSIPAGAADVRVASEAPVIAFPSAEGRRLSVCRLAGERVVCHELGPEPETASARARLSAWALAPGGGRVAATFGNGSVRVWEGASGSPGARLDWPDRGAHARLESLAFGPEGRRLAALASGEIRLWSLGEGEVTHRISGTAAEELRFAGDGRLLLTSNYALGQLDLWDLETGKRAGSVAGVDSLRGLAEGPGGAPWLFPGSGAQSPLLVFPDSPGESMALQCGGEPADSARWSPDGRLVGLIRGGNLCVVDVATRRTVIRFRNEADIFQQVFFGPESDRVFTVSEEGVVARWRLYRDLDRLHERAREAARRLSGVGRGSPAGAPGASDPRAGQG